MPIAYSYIRFSSEKQSRGDSIRRQEELVEKFIEDNPNLDLELDKELTLRDEGLSAYKGLHARKGALGVFIRLVEDDKIARGSYLLVENFDRLSRQEIMSAFAQFQTLIANDIIVVTLSDRRIYSKESINREPMSLMYSIMSMARAYEESQTKSQRVRAAWNNKFKNIKNGVQLTKRVPFWINPENKNQTIDKQVKVVKEIFKLSSEGMGSMRIASYLNENKVPPPKQRSSSWAISSVKKILSSEAVVGTLITADGEIHLNYYPKIISTRLWEKARLLSKTSKGTRNTESTHPLSGLCFCAKCGARAQRSGKTGRLRKDGTKNFWRTLVCANSLNRGSKCGYKSISYELILSEVKSALIQTQYEEPKDDIGKQLHQLEWTLMGLDDIYQELVLEVKNNRDNTIAKLKLSEITRDINEIHQKIKELREAKRPLAIRQVEGARLAILNDGIDSNSNFRLAIRRIDINFDDREIVVTGHDGKVVSAHIKTLKELDRDAL